MKLIDKYILKKFLAAFVFTVLIIVLVILVIDITEKTDNFSESGVSTLQIIGYYANWIPWMANFITPLTTFIATVFVTAQLAGRSEIVAILSSGVSFRRMLIPYLIGASLIAISSFVLNGWIIPNSNKPRIQFEMEHLGKRDNVTHSNIHMQIAPNTYLYLRTYNNQSNVGYNFTLEEMEGTRLVKKISANRMSWDEESQSWKLSAWKTHTLDSLREAIRQGREKDTVLNILPQDFENEYRSYDGMTLRELDDHIDKLKLRGSSNIQVYEVEKYTRFSSPFAVLILTFMGVIVSSRKTRGGAGFQIALGFLLSFLYILFFIIGKSIAEAGNTHPALAVWWPNIIFGTISMLMYKYVPR
jgi:lipopolysaccharide export system permease protein